MAFEQNDDEGVLDAAMARVLQRLATNPGDRSAYRVVSDEFGVGEGALRDWVKAASPAAEPPVAKRRRPRFSPVVTTVKPPVAQDAEPVSPASPASPTSVAAPASPASPAQEAAPASPASPEEPTPRLPFAPQRDIDPMWDDVEPLPSAEAVRPQPTVAAYTAGPVSPDDDVANHDVTVPARVATVPGTIDDRLSALETEAARLRSGNETLKAAMRVLLAD
ncbi:hypothetical protein AS850_08255 [Frondihabitans sp. 762G35]|uniref:hypothetical protein n=1 Tax=Frondihabitans sp. 762G35 TaxID=1446794 RepID=UPI000D228EC7|nr:hypothetical protein [Frondihabitans sp. 762G35]ARC57065.1 hypothetical protein AS850_08255 [Frondihabitans sp. 762G35]